jgi:P-type E1-E2 ATPase
MLSASRSYASIVLANVLTVFNAILIGFGVLTFAFGDPKDALFLGIVVFNSGIGIVQEVRAKRTLDRLAALIAPVATVVRDDRALQVPVAELVVGDLVRVAAGDQVVADGRLETGEGLLLDESILSGESLPVARQPGEEVRSGAFVVEGTGTFVVTAVGSDSYAGRITATARMFRHPASPLERALNRLLLALVAVMVPLGAILAYALWSRRVGLGEAVTTAAAGIVPLVPEGLVLLTRLTHAVATLRMARRGVLAQQLNAIESLASTQVVCLDKTGTLTEATLRVVETVPAPGADAGVFRDALARYAASSPSRNATLAAIADALPSAASPHSGHVPFSSRLRWSALGLGGTTYLLGAPELFPLGALAVPVASAVRQGRRVLAFATTGAAVDPATGPPADATLLGVVVLAERLRASTRETVRYFLSEGVTLKVLSGDAPETVASIAVDAGIPETERVLHGSELPGDPEALGRVARETTVVGRISPDDKRRFVAALGDAGLHVTMIGDGVNDVPALKAARLAVAQGTGTQMAKSVADLVLVRGDFSSVPALVAEGRKILRNLQRVTKLFVTKSAFAAFVLLTVGLTPESYPFLSRHLTLAAGLTIGIPGFFLALAPSAGPWVQAGFLRGVTTFAVPAGTAGGLAVVSGFLFTRNVLAWPLVESRTAAVTALVLVGLYLLLVLEDSRGLRGAVVGGLCLALLGVYVLALALPATRAFFALADPAPGPWLVAVGASGVAIAGLALTDDRFVPRKFLALRSWRRA